MMPAPALAVSGRLAYESIARTGSAGRRVALAGGRLPRLVAIACLLAAVGLPGVTQAQTTPSRIRPDNRDQFGNFPDQAGKAGPVTLISMELLTGDEGVGLQAQRWVQVLQPLEITLTVRRGTASDKPGIKETSQGQTLRKVHIVGRLDKSGRLVFADRVIGPGDLDKLNTWLKELRTYGAQGTPNGQPMWGLSKTQFAALYTVFSQPLTVDVQGENWQTALEQFALPEEYPLEFTEEAKAFIRERAESAPLVRQSFKRVSRGTALAAMLNEQGLAFKPRRTTAGEIRLLIAPWNETGDFWPVGWPLQKTGPATAPKLFDYVQIELEEIELFDVLAAAADVNGVPILINYAGLAVKKVDPATAIVSHPAKRTTWSLALKTLAFQAKARPELLVDEAGHPVVWITPLGAPRRDQ